MDEQIMDTVNDEEGKTLSFGEHLRICRHNRKMSQTQLARETGIDASKISLYETGKAKPSYENLNKLAHGLKMDPGLFLRENALTRTPLIRATEWAVKRATKQLIHTSEKIRDYPDKEFENTDPPYRHIASLVSIIRNGTHILNNSAYYE